jgi:hypothetical protein
MPTFNRATNMKVFLDGHKSFEKKFKFHFFTPEVHVHKNGFISVRIDWGNSKSDEFSKFKYAKLTHRSYGGSFFVKKKKYFNIVSASFEFEDVINECEKLNITPWFNVCIASDTEEGSFDEEFDYLFFENLKYGLICWFAPKGWEDWLNAKLYLN